MKRKSYNIENLKMLIYQISDIKLRLSELNINQLTIGQDDLNYLIHKCETLMKDINNLLSKKTKNHNIEHIRYIITYITNLNSDLKEIEEVIYN